MARPSAKDLTERELEVMHVFWGHGELTAAEARDHLTARGRALSAPTVINLIRDLHRKGFLAPVASGRPARYRAARSLDEVSGRLLGDLVERVFSGSRERLLAQLVGGSPLTPEERQLLEDVLKEDAR
jgi:predicted transcriptional regulator